ncbi:MAG: SPASM domain-containing protein [Deltaproteobacteria bacterium]|nr:SPASM domain-containing protein [Deltaproteobacteria bacterium]
MSIEGIHQVQLEINNRCSYAHMHPRCPASLVTETKYLDDKIVYRVLDHFADHGYTGEVIFSVYNEPLEDPRLFEFLEFLRVNMRIKATPYVITNGRCLDQYLLTRLTQIYGARVITNGYTPEEAARLRTLKGGARYSVREERLDSRLQMYDRDPVDLSMPCHAPKKNLTIWHTGEVGLCCRDWKHTCILGDLNDQSLAEILESERRLKAVENLENGKRCYDVCRKCARVWK